MQPAENSSDDVNAQDRSNGPLMEADDIADYNFIHLELDRESEAENEIGEDIPVSPRQCEPIAREKFVKSGKLIVMVEMNERNMQSMLALLH